MSKDIFMADYSSCRDTNREIQSNINYIEEIISKLNKMSNCVEKVSVSANIWNKSDYEYGLLTLKNYLNNEVERYGNFHSEFNKFHTPLETIDSGLKAILENALKFVDENKEYDVYMSIIKNSQVDSMQESIYLELISQGISEEDARKLLSLENEENQKLLEELSLLNESELRSKLSEIKNKIEKSPFELLLIDIFSGDKINTYSDIIKDFSEEFATGGLVGVLQNKYFSKSLDKYNLDIRSLTGQINKLQNEIMSNQLSRRKINLKAESLEKLKVIRENKISNVNRHNAVKTNLSSLSKWLNVAGYVYVAVDLGKDEYENYTEAGMELDDALVDTGLEVAGIVASGVGAGIATSEVASIIGSSAGPVGTVVGMVAGFIGGAVVGGIWGGIVKPIATDAYNDYIEPLGEKSLDVTNDVKDWWDSLWW